VNPTNAAQTSARLLLAMHSQLIYLDLALAALIADFTWLPPDTIRDRVARLAADSATWLRGHDA